jgi:hypothetical protein
MGHRQPNNGKETPMRLVSILTAAAFGLVAAGDNAHAQATPPQQKSDSQVMESAGKESKKPAKSSRKSSKKTKQSR